MGKWENEETHYWLFTVVKILSACQFSRNGLDIVEMDF